MRIDQTVKVSSPSDQTAATTVTIAYVFHTTAVTTSVFFEEEIERAIPPMGGGPPGWVPIELRIAAHLGCADLETWERVPVIEDDELRQICEQARSKAAWRAERHKYDVDRITIELRPAPAEQAAYRQRSPMELAFEVANASAPVQAFLAREKADMERERAAAGDAFDWVSWEHAYRMRLAQLLHGGEP